MAVPGPALRLLAGALLTLLVTFAAVPLARADRWDGWDGEPAGQPADPSAWGDAGVPVQPQPAPLPAPDQDPAVDLPARPWTPPAPATPPAPVLPTIPVPKAKIIPGRRALIRADGKAAIPRGAPKSVRVAIAAANRIIGKPYKWGGGHGSFYDTGYDCSGSVGFSLVNAGLMPGIMVSGQMARWGSSGPGRWVSVFANSGHAYMEVAGLRLDTSPYGDPTGRMGVRWRQPIGRRSGFAVRHPLGF